MLSRAVLAKSSLRIWLASLRISTSGLELCLKTPSGPKTLNSAQKLASHRTEKKLPAIETNISIPIIDPTSANLTGSFRKRIAMPTPEIRPAKVEANIATPPQSLSPIQYSRCGSVAHSPIPIQRHVEAAKNRFSENWVMLQFYPTGGPFSRRDFRRRMGVLTPKQEPRINNKLTLNCPTIVPLVKSRDVLYFGGKE